MSLSLEPERFRGVYVFCTTPFKSSPAEIQCHTGIDEEGLRANIRFLIKNGVRHLVPCGGTGEFPSLDWDEYRTVVRIVREEADTDTIVMPGVGYNLDDAIHMAQYAESIGCQGVMLFPPAIQSSEEGLYQFHARLAEKVNIAIMTYAMTTLSLNFLQKIAALDRLVIIKDSTNDLAWSRRMISATRDYLLWICEGEAIAPYYFLHSLDGFTSGVAAVLPELSLRMYSAAKEQDFRTVVSIQKQLEPLNRLRGRPGNHVPVVKAALDMMGLAGGPVRPPLLPLSDVERAELAEILQGLGHAPHV